MADRGLPTTQTDAAKFAGVTQPAARKWQYGGFPDMDRVIEIAEKLDVSLDWLLRGEGPKRPPRYSEGDERFAELLNLWTRADEGEKQNMIEVARMLARRSRPHE